jgi:hypothetical protein
LRYQSGYNGNAIINGGMDIWQRGTSFAYLVNTGLYTADRWTTIRTASPSGATVSRQASSLTGIQYCARVQRDSGNTSTAVMFFGTNLESADSYRFAGQTVTLSYYARAGANYSPTSSGLSANILTGTGTDQSFITGLTGSTNAGNATATLTTSWQRFTVTGTIGSTATQIAVYFTMTPTGTAGANDYFEVTGVQLELGSVATQFKRSNGSGGTIQGELSACQRYLPAISGATNSILGFAYSTTGSQIFIKLPTTARVAPTGITVNPTLTANYALVNQGFTSGTPTAIAWNAGGTDYASINVTTTAGSPTLVAGQPVQLQTNASGYILFTGCEL